MNTECAILHKKLCFSLLVMVLANLSGPLRAQFVDIDIELHARIEMRMISPEAPWARLSDMAERHTTPGDGTLLPDALLWLEISSVENMELLIDAGGEHPLYYINTGVFDPEQAVLFNESTAFRLSKGGRPNANTRLFRAWIGIRPGETRLVNINYN